jgi:hypothetical protein
MNMPLQQFQPQVNSQFTADMTHADLSSHLAPVSGSGGLYIQFYYARVRIEQPDNPAVHGTWRTRLCVAKAPKGDRLTVSARFITEEQAMQRYPREFAMFKHSEAIPTSGTPLHELPGISQSQIALLVLHNLRCIEDVADARQETINPMGMDAMSAHALAVRWVRHKEANGAVIQEAIGDATKDAELATLRRQTADQQQAIAELRAKVDILTQIGGQVPQLNIPPAAAMETPDIVPAPVNRSFVEGSAQIAVTGNDDLNDPDPLGLNR